MAKTHVRVGDEYLEILPESKHYTRVYIVNCHGETRVYNEKTKQLAKGPGTPVVKHGRRSKKGAM